MRQKLWEWFVRANLWLDRRLLPGFNMSYEEWQNTRHVEIDLSEHPTPEEFERRCE